MNDDQRSAIRAALHPVINNILHNTVADPRHPADDDDFSGTEALFENLALGVKGIADDIIREYEAGYMKGRASIQSGTK